MKTEKTVYIIIGTLVVIVILAASYKLVKKSQNASMSQSKSTTSMSLTSSPTPPSSSGLMNKTDASDGQLDKDLQDVKTSMDKLNTDQSQAADAVANQTSDSPTQ